MVLTGLPADGKASFWIAPHCGFRYRKRRFYRILMLLARHDGHMNDSNAPYSKNRENQSKSLLFMNGGRAKTTTNRTRRRKLSIYSIGTASKYCATPVAFAEPATVQIASHRPKSRPRQPTQPSRRSNRHYLAQTRLSTNRSPKSASSRRIRNRHPKRRNRPSLWSHPLPQPSPRSSTCVRGRAE